MSEIHVSGTTFEEALNNGLEQLGVARELVDVEELSSAHDDTLPGAEPLEGVTLRLRVKTDAIAATAKAHLVKVLELIGLKPQVEVLHRRGAVVLNVVAGGDGSLIIGRNGQNLAALQVLISRMVVHGGREVVPIIVDSEGYRERRMARLEQMAQRIARQVQRENREVALEPMPPAERKVVHMLLKEVRGVHTISRGEGIARHIVVTPGSPDAAGGLLRPGKRREGSKEVRIISEDSENFAEREDFRTDIDALLMQDDDE